MLFFELLVAILAGCFIGIITGLTPGVHVNLVAVLLVSLSGFFLGFTSPIVLGTFIVALAVTHTFLDAIPSIFLGAPDADMALNVLPGHRMLLQGMGYEAVKLTVIGSLMALIFTIIFMPFVLPFLPMVYSFLQPYIGYILILVVIYMLLKESSLNGKFFGFVVFMLSGILGLIVLNWQNLGQPLFPLLSGIFGISSLLLSLSENVALPKQRVTEIVKVEKNKAFRAIAGAVFFGSLAALFPGLGSAQAAIIAMQVVGEIGMYAFIILIGGMNTVNFTFSLATLYSLQKARNGAIVAVLEIIKSVDMNGLLIFIGTALLAGGIATFLTLGISRVFANLINRVNYKMLALSVIAFITVLTPYFSGFAGFLILITSTAVGLVAPLAGVKRSNAMGCLLLPVILFFVL